MTLCESIASVIYDFIPIALPSPLLLSVYPENNDKGASWISFSCYTPLTHILQSQRKYMHHWPESHLFVLQYLKLLLIRQHKISYLNCKNNIFFFLCKSSWIVNMICQLHMPNIVCVFLETGNNSVGEIPVTLCNETYTLTKKISVKTMLQ